MSSSVRFHSEHENESVDAHAMKPEVIKKVDILFQDYYRLERRLDDHHEWIDTIKEKKAFEERQEQLKKEWKCDMYAAELEQLLGKISSYFQNDQPRFSAFNYLAGCVMDFVLMSRMDRAGDKLDSVVDFFMEKNKEEKKQEPIDYEHLEDVLLETTVRGESELIRQAMTIRVRRFREIKRNHGADIACQIFKYPYFPKGSQEEEYMVTCLKKGEQPKFNMTASVPTPAALKEQMQLRRPKGEKLMENANDEEKKEIEQHLKVLSEAYDNLENVLQKKQTRTAASMVTQTLDQKQNQ